MIDTSELLAFVEDPADYVAIGRDEERIRTARAVVTFEPGDHFWSTTVTRVRFADGDVAAEVSELRSLMRSRGRRAAAWAIGPSATPGDVLLQLIELGLERESASASSILVLSHEPNVRPSAFEVRPVTTFEDHVAAIRVANEGFSLSAHDAADELHRARETFEAERAGEHTARLLALDHGRPVATGRAWFALQGVYLGGGTTIPSHRQRGAMGSLVMVVWDGSGPSWDASARYLRGRHVDIPAQASRVPNPRPDRASDRPIRPPRRRIGTGEGTRASRNIPEHSQASVPSPSP